MNVSLSPYSPLLEDHFFLGSFAPFLRAFDNPIAIACLRLLILCLPLFLWRISVRTSELAFLLYLRRDFFLAGIRISLFNETPRGRGRVALPSAPELAVKNGI